MIDLSKVWGGGEMPPGSVVGERRTSLRGQVFLWTGSAWMWVPK